MGTQEGTAGQFVVSIGSLTEHSEPVGDKDNKAWALESGAKADLETQGDKQ
jgi:hypothetical protein